MTLPRTVLFCVCPHPAYGARLDGCLRCHRPPLAGCRAELGLITKDARWADS